MHLSESVSMFARLNCLHLYLLIAYSKGGGSTPGAVIVRRVGGSDTKQNSFRLKLDSFWMACKFWDSFCKVVKFHSVVFQPLH